MRFGILLICVCCLQAADIHVASNGNDSSGDGSQGSPYATVAKGLSLAGSGDRVLLRRGDVFREGGLSVGSGRSLSAYGTGDDPVIAGSTVVSGFTAHGGGVYKATVDIGSRDTELCFVDGELLTIARYPNSGWLRCDTGSTGDQIICSELDGLKGVGYWNDGKLRWRRWSWFYETRGIASDDGAGTLALAARDFSAPTNVGIDSGFYIDHLLSECDAPGEWYYDNDSNTLYIYPPASANPASMLVEICSRDQGLSLNGGTLSGICLRHYDIKAINVGSPSSIDNCTVAYCVNGITGSWGAGGSDIGNSRIHDILNNGISWNENPGGASGTTIHDSSIERIGVIPGYGGSGTWHASGIIVSNGNAVTITHNVIDRVGYAGTILGSDGQVVHQNIYRECMETMNDGAAIYTNSNANIITDNIVLETIGDLDSSQPWYPLGHGIWPEFLEGFEDHVITGNTIVGCGGNGIFLTNNYSATVSENICFSNRLGGIHISGRYKGVVDGSTVYFPANQGNSITDNIFAVGAEAYNTGRPENLGEWNYLRDFDTCLRFNDTKDDSGNHIDNDYGSMAGNTFLRPNSDIPWLVDTRTEDINTDPYMTIAEWQSQEAAWADAGIDTVEADAYLFINDSTSTASFPLPSGVTWQRLDGSSVSGTVSIAAYRSVVLVATAGDTSGIAGYLMLSEQTPRRITAVASSGAGGWILSPDEGTVIDNGNDISASNLKSGSDYSLTPITPGGG